MRFRSNILIWSGRATCVAVHAVQSRVITGQSRMTLPARSAFPDATFEPKATKQKLEI